MPVKKTVAKKTTTKPATKTTKKPTTKHVAAAKVVEAKKPTVVVETKKTDRCECGDNCNCGCNCGCGLKIVILVLIILNLLVALFTYFKKNPWDLTITSLWWEANKEKVVNDLYNDENYSKYNKDLIESQLTPYLED